MSAQIPDTFIWNGKKYAFSRAENIYTLFDPEAFGLHPTEPHTACWKGFVLHFEMIDSQLCLSELEVYCDDGNYPDINGVKAVYDNDCFYVYKNLHMKLMYTGRIIIGTELRPECMLSAFPGPHSYEKTYDLHIKDGVLISYEDSTGKYSLFDN